jgi:hypothetical protein
MKLPVVTKTTDYTILVADLGKEFVFTGPLYSNFLLPTAAAAGNGAVLAFRNVGGGSFFSVSPDGAEKIDGMVGGRNLSPGDNVVIRCDGVEWRTISGVYTKSNSYTLAASGNFAAPVNGFPVKSLRAQLVNLTTQYGYAVGDAIDIAMGNFSTSVATAAMTVKRNSSGNWAVVSGTTLPAVAAATGGVGGVLTAANWQVNITIET